MIVLTFKTKVVSKLPKSCLLYILSKTHVLLVIRHTNLELSKIIDPEVSNNNLVYLYGLYTVQIAYESHRYFLLLFIISVSK